MPLQHRFGLYDEEKIAPPAEAVACKDPKESIRGFEVRTGTAALERQQLLPQAKVFSDEERFRLQCRQNGPHHESKHLSPPALGDGSRSQRPTIVNCEGPTALLRPTTPAMRMPS